jgi:N6-adenosine-specific RNA methylase IME4
MKKSSTALTVIKPIKPPTNLKTLGNVLAKAKTPEAVLAFERMVAAYESYMRRAGYSQGDLHEINEARMRARWRLGQMLAKVARQKGGKGVRAAHGLLETLKRLKLERSRAIEAQRIGCLPKIELERNFQKARKLGELVTITGLVDEARPYWYKANRKAKHVSIVEAAVVRAATEKVKTFPLLYIDPPTEYEVYSDKGLERSPDQHYPTMTDSEIIDYVRPFLPKVGAVFWWCTSSNVHRALAMLDHLDIDFKSSAVWVKHDASGKPVSGTGHIFRNQHELLLYGTRGGMPGPQYAPPSAFLYPRGRHSAKPPEIRAQIEKMYPDFDAATRCELFCREHVDSWTTFGYEAVNEAAE